MMVIYHRLCHPRHLAISLPLVRTSLPLVVPTPLLIVPSLPLVTPSLPLVAPPLPLVAPSLPLVAISLPQPKILRLPVLEFNLQLKIFQFSSSLPPRLEITLAGVVAKGIEIILEVKSVKTIILERGKRGSITTVCKHDKLAWRTDEYLLQLMHCPPPLHVTIQYLFIHRLLPLLCPPRHIQLLRKLQAPSLGTAAGMLLLRDCKLAFSTNHGMSDIISSVIFLLMPTQQGRRCEACSQYSWICILASQ